MVNYCKCGCRTEIAEGNNWAPGHHRRGIKNKGYLGHKHSDISKEKISDANMGNKKHLGHKHSDISKEKISQTLKENFNNPDFKEHHHMWYNHEDPDDGVVMLSPYSHRMGHTFLRACGVEIEHINIKEE